MYSIETDCFLRQLKIILSKSLSIQTYQKLKDPARYLHHICQFSWRQDDDILHDPKQEKRTEHLLCVHYVMQPFAVKKKETVFYNITHKPAVTHVLKNLLEHNFHDVKILII